MTRLDQSNWLTVASNSGPYSGNDPQLFSITQPCDRLLITIDSPGTNGDWVRAGYAHYVWIRNGEPFQLNSSLIYLKTSVLMTVEPLASGTLAFDPKTWIGYWSITIEGRLIA